MHSYGRILASDISTGKLSLRMKLPKYTNLILLSLGFCLYGVFSIWCGLAGRTYGVQGAQIKGIAALAVGAGLLVVGIPGLVVAAIRSRRHAHGEEPGP